jgi:hypothetical protein
MQKTRVEIVYGMPDFTSGAQGYIDGYVHDGVTKAIVIVKGYLYQVPIEFLQVIEPTTVIPIQP